MSYLNEFVLDKNKEIIKGIADSILQDSVAESLLTIPAEILQKAVDSGKVQVFSETGLKAYQADLFKAFTQKRIEASVCCPPPYPGGMRKAPRLPGRLPRHHLPWQTRCGRE